MSAMARIPRVVSKRLPSRRWTKEKWSRFEKESKPVTIEGSAATGRRRLVNVGVDMVIRRIYGGMQWIRKDGPLLIHYAAVYRDHHDQLRVLSINQHTPKSEMDWVHLHFLRACCDGILTTGQILRSEPSLTFEHKQTTYFRRQLMADREDIVDKTHDGPLQVYVLTSGDHLLRDGQAGRSKGRPMLEHKTIKHRSSSCQVNLLVPPDSLPAVRKALDGRPWVQVLPISSPPSRRAASAYARQADNSGETDTIPDIRHLPSLSSHAAIHSAISHLQHIKSTRAPANRRQPAAAQDATPADRAEGPSVRLGIEAGASISRSLLLRKEVDVIFLTVYAGQVPQNCQGNVLLSADELRARYTCWRAATEGHWTVLCFRPRQ